MALPAVPLAAGPQQLKQAAFSTYPHYGNNQWHNILGYSMTTRLDGVEWRYTEWVPFDSNGDWTMVAHLHTEHTRHTLLLRCLQQLASGSDLASLPLTLSCVLVGNNHDAASEF